MRRLGPISAAESDGSDDVDNEQIRSVTRQTIVRTVTKIFKSVLAAMQCDLYGNVIPSEQDVSYVWLEMPLKEDLLPVRPVSPVESVYPIPIYPD